MVQNSELRRRAREQLGSNIFNPEWLYLVLAVLVAGVILSASSLGYVAALILMGPIEYGLARIFILFSREGKRADLTNLFDGFRENFGQTLLLGFLKNLFIALWSLLLIVPGIVKYYSYSMATYIQQDSPNKDWRYCLDESRRMMDGHKMDLFLLELSFIGWLILGALCFGVGTLWVSVYMETAKANFYEELRGPVIITPNNDDFSPTDF